MNALIAQPRRSLPVWFSVGGWLSVFLCPSGYFLLILLADRFHIPSPPETLVWSLFFLIPLVALVICESVVWLSSKTLGRKIGWMDFTLLAMLLQSGIIVDVLRAILVARIGYAR